MSSTEESASQNPNQWTSCENSYECIELISNSDDDNPNIRPLGFKLVVICKIQLHLIFTRAHIALNLGNLPPPSLFVSPFPFPLRFLFDLQAWRRANWTIVKRDLELAILKSKFIWGKCFSQWNCLDHFATRDQSTWDKLPLPMVSIWIGVW